MFADRSIDSIDVIIFYVFLLKKNKEIKLKMKDENPIDDDDDSVNCFVFVFHNVFFKISIVSRYLLLAWLVFGRRYFFLSVAAANDDYCAELAICIRGKRQPVFFTCHFCCVTILSFSGCLKTLFIHFLAIKIKIVIDNHKRGPKNYP